MTPNQKGKKPAKKLPSLAAKKIDAKEARQVKGGARRRDESPKETTS